MLEAGSALYWGAVRFLQLCVAHSVDVRHVIAKAFRRDV